MKNKVKLFGIGAIAFVVFFTACKTDVGKSSLIDMVWVPGGTFLMGSLEGVGSSDEHPPHQVTLTGFRMGKYQVTQGEYLEVMGTNPSIDIDNPWENEVQEKRPVENVSWYNAVEFCNILSELEGLKPYYDINKEIQDPDNSHDGDPIKWLVTRDESANGYRLPTEAQWEYAARGGNNSPGDYIYSGSDDPDEVAWYSPNSNGRTHQVGLKKPNSLGLYDMSGNVYERCWDWYDENYYEISPSHNPTGPSSGNRRVARGGGSTFAIGAMRSAYRNWGYPNGTTRNSGFRVVRP